MHQELAIAIEKGQTEKAKELIDSGISIEEGNEHGSTALMLAIRKENTELVRYLIEEKGANVNALNHAGWSPLMYAACYSNDPDILVLLFNKDPDFSTVNQDGDNALHLAIKRGARDLIPLLLTMGADATLANPDKNGYSALMLAVKAGRLDIVKDLHTYGADLNAQAPGTSIRLLEFAVSQRQQEIALYLLNSGADANFPCQRGWTLITTAAQAGLDALVQPLVDRGVSLDATTPSSGSTALMIAVQQRKPNFVAALLLAGANPNIPDKNGRTPLMHAIMQGDEHLVLLLSRHPGINLDTVSARTGSTALIMAVQQNKPKLAEVLLRSGANPGLADKSGHTPEYYAHKHSQPALGVRLRDEMLARALTGFQRTTLNEFWGPEGYNFEDVVSCDALSNDERINFLSQALSQEPPVFAKTIESLITRGLAPVHLALNQLNTLYHNVTKKGENRSALDIFFRLASPDPLLIPNYKASIRLAIHERIAEIRASQAPVPAESESVAASSSSHAPVFASSASFWGGAGVDKSVQASLNLRPN
jgi:ankyrin repeat protein